MVAETCNRVGVMYAGTMAEIGTTNDVFKDPLHPYTKGLMNLLPNIKVTKDHLETIEGVVPNLVHPPTGCRFHPRCPRAMECSKHAEAYRCTRFIRGISRPVTSIRRETEWPTVTSWRRAA